MGQAELQKRRASVMLPPTDPSLAEQQKSSMANPPAANVSSAKPFWLATVCTHRDEFAEVALVFFLEEDTCYYQIAYAMQSPQFCCLSPLVPAPSVSSKKRKVGHRTFQKPSPVWDHQFTPNFLENISHEDAPVTTPEDLYVLPYLCLMEADLVTSHADMMSWTEFTKHLPKGRQPPTSETEARPWSSASLSAAQSDASQPAWLQDYVQRRAQDRMSPGVPSADDQSAMHAMGGPPDQSSVIQDLVDTGVSGTEEDDLLADCWAAVSAKRHEWHSQATGVVSDFKTSLLGGAWTQQHRQKPYDAVRSSARTQASKDWCGKYGLNLSSRYELDVFGDRLCAVFTTEWCRRMQYLFDLYLAAGSDDYRYTDVDLGEYVESAAFSECFEALQGRALVRGLEIRGITPRGPV